MASRQRIQVANVHDWTGGLNLRADSFQLAPNESPDLLNVEVDPRGGFRLRKGVSRYANAMAAVPITLGSYEPAGGTSRVIVQEGVNLRWSTGAGWTTFYSNGSSAKCRMVTFKDRLYVQNGTDPASRWDGSTALSLGTTTFNDDLTNPTTSGSTGNMPRAKCIAVHQGSVWVANVVESAGTFKNRVRWSHPNFPEDFRSFDFIDVDTGMDGDEITALVPFGDRLLVFKRKSVHAIYGFGPDGFQVLPVTQASGAISQEAVVNTDVGVWYFSWPNGLMLYDGKKVENVFERLYPAISGGSIPDQYQDKIAVGWLNRKVWVSVPWGSSTVNARTFVLDPTLGKGGAWVAYDLGLSCFFNYRPVAADTLFLAGSSTLSSVLKLEQDQAFDAPAGSNVHIASYYRTRWIDFGQSAVRKTWKRPEVVLMGGTTVDLLVDVFHDYDASLAKKHFRFVTAADPNVFTWDGDSGHGWDSGAVWARDSSTINAVDSGAALGVARSVSLQFNGPLTNASWGVDSLALKFIPKPVRK